GPDGLVAAIALADLQDAQGFRKLLGMIARPSRLDLSEPKAADEPLFHKRQAAIEGIAYFQSPDAAAALAQIVEDPKEDRRLRPSTALLFWVGADARSEIACLTGLRE